MTKKVAVIGHPISHSLSPKLHNYWIEKYGIDAEYIALDVKPEELRDTIKRMQDEGYVGCNVTIPHKEAMLDIVDELWPLPRIIGSVNTILFNKKDNKIDGYSTDGFGFMQSIKISPKKALVLGAGGASRAVCAALSSNKCKEIILTNRTRERAEKLAKSIYPVKVIDWDEKEKYLSDIDLLVNTTSLGMEGMTELEIDLSTLNKDALVIDIVYKPLITPLLAQAEAQGNRIVDGLGMFLYQAQQSFYIWFGITPEVTPELRKYILENIK